MAVPLFDEHKAAQAAAFLLNAGGGTLPLLKLIKLMYLAERRSLERFGEPLTGDALVAMPHGPVLSATLDHANGFVEGAPDGWEAWVADRAGHDVALRDPSRLSHGTEVLDHLSMADMEVLTETWARYGDMGHWALRDYTHDALAEWEDPMGSQYPITYNRLFTALGYEPQQVDAMVAHLREQEALIRACAA